MKNFDAEDDDKWTDIELTLARIANKELKLGAINPNAWCAWDEHLVTVKCFICNKIIENHHKDPIKNMYVTRRHGYQHLVDKKLLAFI